MDTVHKNTSSKTPIDVTKPVRYGKTRTAYEICKQYGLSRSAFRFRYAISRRTGWLKRRFPTGPWDSRPLADWCTNHVPAEPDAYRTFRQKSDARFFFPPGQLPKVPEICRKDVVERADAVLNGRVTYFSRLTADIGFPFDWFSNPFTGTRTDVARHWCDRGEFERDQGDIKVIWEPSRFAWVYDLMRAYAANGAERYARGFWELVESWRQANPPNMGPNWQCGQECSFRAFALCFGLFAFWDAQGTTTERVAMLSQTLAFHAERIDANIEFAISQKNNHALSEAAALYVIGTLFPEFRNAADWKQRGKELLEKEAFRQIYDDGCYVQQSMNYHRVMLHNYLLALRLAQCNGDHFDAAVTDRLKRATEFLYQLQDEPSGRVPNYGANDGTLVLPLSSCDYLDYRPVLQAMHYQLHRKRLYESGTWDEVLIWLFGPEAIKAPVEKAPQVSSEFAAGGYYTLRGGESWAMIRCHSYRDRPGQAHMLHLDLWWRGRNILRDSGSYSYNAPPPWNHYFISTAAHNTIQIDGQDQMINGPHFIWFDWTRSQFLERQRDEAQNTELWNGEHYGYRRLGGVVHRRTVRRSADTQWTVVDDLKGSGTHQVVLHWHLIDIDWAWEVPGRELRLDLPEGNVWIRLERVGGSDTNIEVVRGLENEQQALGWDSLYYGERRPTPVIRLTCCGTLPIRIKTSIGLGQRIDCSRT